MAETLLVKKVAESRVFSFDFSDYPEIVGGATITSATVVASPTGPTIGSPLPTVGIVQVRISGGLDGTTYEMTCTAVTNAGDTLVGCGQLQVTLCGDT